MTIHSNRTTGVKTVLTTDVVIYAVPTGERITVESMNVYNTGVAWATLSFYASPDGTSVSGDQIATVIIPDGESRDINAIVGAGYTKNLIVIADIVGCNLSMTYTNYTGDDV